MVMIYPFKGLFRASLVLAVVMVKTEVDHEHGKYAKKII